MKGGADHRIGPLAPGDPAGLDFRLGAIATFHGGFDDRKYRPSRFPMQITAAGHLGGRTGRGFAVCRAQ